MKSKVKVVDKVAEVSAEDAVVKAEVSEVANAHYKQDCADIKELLTKMNQTLEKILTHINGGF